VEDDAVATNFDRPVWITRCAGEVAWNTFWWLHDQPTAQFHILASNYVSGLGLYLHRIRIKEFEADLVQDEHRISMDAFYQ
jgi:hypothetical protein